MGMAMTSLGGLCSILAVVGWIWLLIVIFQSGDILWGVLGLFCGLLALVWGLTHMEQAKQPLLLFVIGLVGSAIFGGIGGAMGGLAGIGG